MNTLRLWLVRILLTKDERFTIAECVNLWASAMERRRVLGREWDAEEMTQTNRLPKALS